MISIHSITKQDDLQKIIHNIHVAPWSDASDINHDDYSVGSLESYLSQPNAKLFFAYDDTAFAGMASAHILLKPSGEKWLYIDELDVCENMQRRGVGKSMMKYMLEFAKNNACSEVWLGTEVDNVPANALYTSLNPTDASRFYGYTYELNG